MTILVVYATNSSGTMLASELVRDILKQHGHTVALKRANTVGPEELKSYELIILGSCTWERFEGAQHLQGQLQQHMYELGQKLNRKNVLLPGHRFAVFALGDSSYTQFAGAADRLRELIDGVGGQLITEPLRIDGWFFHPDENEKSLTDWAEHIAASLSS